MLLARLYKPQSSSQAWAASSRGNLRLYSYRQLHISFQDARVRTSALRRTTTRQQPECKSKERFREEWRATFKSLAMPRHAAVSKTRRGVPGSSSKARLDDRSKMMSQRANMHTKNTILDLERRKTSLLQSGSQEAGIQEAGGFDTNSNTGFGKESMKPNFGRYNLSAATVDMPGKRPTTSSKVASELQQDTSMSRQDQNSTIRASKNSMAAGKATTSLRLNQEQFAGGPMGSRGKSAKKSQGTPRREDLVPGNTDTRSSPTSHRSLAQKSAQAPNGRNVFLSAFSSGSTSEDHDFMPLEGVVNNDANLYGKPFQRPGKVEVATTSTRKLVEGTARQRSVTSGTVENRVEDARQCYNDRQDFAKRHGATVQHKVEAPEPLSAATGAAVNSTMSLFEQLFPEERRQAQKQARSQKPKDNLAHEFDWAKAWPQLSIYPEPSKPDQNNTSCQSSITNNDPNLMKIRRDATVLVLSRASPNLSSSDFYRLCQKGYHIDGWLSGIIKIMPGRDPQTLANLGHYFILFSSSAAAQAYQDRVLRLHKIAQTYTPTGIGRAMLPPPGHLKDGEDIHQLMSEFTLIPASQPSAMIRMLPKPYSPTIRRLIKDGGEQALVRRQAKSENLVLINFDNGGDFGHVSEHEVRRWLSLDGRKRGLSWGLINDLEDIVRIGIRDDRNPDKKAESEDPVRSPEKEKTSQWSTRLPSRYVLSFREQNEARRFVRTWHKRLFTLDGRSRGSDWAGNAPTYVNAELLW